MQTEEVEEFLRLSDKRLQRLMIGFHYAMHNIPHEQQNNQTIKDIMETGFLQARKMLCEIRGNWQAENIENINVGSPSDENIFEWVLIRELVNQLEWMNTVTDSVKNLSLD